MKKVLIEVDVDEEGAVKGLNKIDKGVDNVGKSAKETKKGLSTMEKGFKAIASAAIVITVIVSAFQLLKKAFTSSEEGQNRYNKAIAVLESIFNNLVDVIANISEGIVDMFENPKEALDNFANLIKENIINRFEGLLELLPQLGKAIGLLFEGEFSAAAEVATNAVAKVTLGVEDIVGKTKEAIAATSEFINEIVREADVAAGIADKRALADKKDRELIVARAQAAKEIAERREKAADKENVSTAERIRLLTEAGEISAEITRKEIEAARLRFEAIQEENKLSNSNKEALDAEAQAKAELINLETARLQQQKALTAELTTTRREAEAEQKAIDAEKKAQELEDIKEIAAAKKVADDAEIAAQKIITDEAKKASDEALSVAKEESNAKVALASTTAAAVAQFAEEGSDLQKAAGVAGVLINIQQAIMGAIAGAASVGPFGVALGIANAAVSTAIGLKSIQNILKTKTGKSVKSNSGGGSASAPSANIAPPTFQAPTNNANQLGDTISDSLNTQQPTKAYVVSGDITTAQQMDRVVVNNSTL